MGPLTSVLGTRRMLEWGTSTLSSRHMLLRVVTGYHVYIIAGI